MKKLLFTLFLVQLSNLIEVLGQSSSNPLSGISGTITADQQNKTINCGAVYLYFADLKAVSGTFKDSIAFIDHLESLGKTAAGMNNIHCAKCDDPAMAGCELKLDLIFASDLGMQKKKKGDQFDFSIEAQEVAFRISCTYCDAQSKQNPIDDIPNIVTPLPNDAAQHGSKCGETHFLPTTLQGLLYKKGSVDQAYDSLLAMIQRNHQYFGLQCGLCPDKTPCKLKVEGVLHDSGKKEFPQLVKVDSTSEGVSFKAQNVFIRYSCSSCEDEKEDESSSSTTPSVPDALPRLPRDDDKAYSAGNRIEDLRLEPITYVEGPPFEEGHAFITFTMLPGDEIHFLNARFTHPVTGQTAWLIRNVPIPPLLDNEELSYRINTSTLGDYAMLRMDYTSGPEWYTTSSFDAPFTQTLTPQPVQVITPSGSNDPGVFSGAGPIEIAVYPPLPKGLAFKHRGCDIPNHDLDNSKHYPDDNPTPNDRNACGPTSAANSLEWLKKQHKELAGETMTHRAKIDSLKKYMNLNKKDTNGVRFDSMVVGKLTLIDKLKLPIRVKYQTKHKSGYEKELVSTDGKYEHKADNHGQPGVHPNFDWFKKEMDDGEDVEVHVGWYGPPADDGVRPRHGGHWVTASGYFSTNMIKGIYIKDDVDQENKGGLRHEYYTWGTLGSGQPYLEGLTDDKGNIAIVESVVSESYDPAVTFDDEPLYEHPSPWEKVSLTGTEAKIIAVPVIPVKTSSAFVPIVTGVVTTGALVYIITQDNDDPVDCAFTATATTVSPRCGQPNGAIQIAIDPPAQYDFIWSNGSTAQSLSDLAAGTYGVTITRPGTSCNQILSHSLVNMNDTFDATISSTPADCGVENGTVSVTTDPPGAYTYIWSNGATSSNQTSLATGTYSITVSLGGTCVQEYSTEVGQNPFEPNITFTTTPAECGITDGTATVLVDPPGAYQFTWSNGQSGASVTELGAGQHSVTVTLPGSTCSATASVSIEESSPTHITSIDVTHASCGSENGAAVVNTELPSSFYSFIWSTGNQNNEVSTLPPGSHTVTVTLNGTNCAETATVVIEELPAPFTLSSTTTSATCGEADGSAMVHVSDLNLQYEYAWNVPSLTNQIFAVPAGTYSVTVTISGTTCAQTLEITIDELPAAFTLTTSTTPAGCGATDGTASVVVDPPDTYSYQWSNGQTTEQAVNLGSGVYTVTVTLTGTACAQTAEVTVDQLPVPFTLSFSSTPANCGQGDGTATVTPDPAGEYTYAWPDGQMTPAATGLMSGIHQVTVTIPGTTCSQTIDVEVGQVPLEVSTTTSSTPAGCGIANGTASVDTVISPPGFLISMEWSNGQMGPEATGLFPGTYTVTITLQAPECFLIHTDTVIVEQVQPNFTGTITTTPADCGIANGSATIVVVPDGAYTYVWSNQQTGSVLQNVMAGTYSVVVTDANSCTASFSTDIPQLPVEHITITGTTPGNCTGGGEVMFVLTTNGAGPLVVEVTGPESTITFTAAPGNYALSAFTTVVPGTYTINVYDQGAGASCIESVMATVQDQTPALSAIDDTYFTEIGQPVDGNMLDNDSGLNLAVTDVDNIFGGTVTFNAIGDFAFTPNPGFTGDGMFTYTVTDACGDVATAVVTITVELVECNFTIQTTIIPANCGVSNGYINIEVNEPGSYTYFWDTGDTGSELEDVAAGTYTVTITDVNLGCALEFTIEVTEFPAEYIDDLVVLQPTCSSPGEIQFTLSVPGPQDLLTMSVDHPNGIDVFFVDPGITRLSDFIDIVEGPYTVEVFIGNAGPECVQSFDVIINPVPTLTIFEEAVFPPSEPTAMDGMAIVIIEPPFGQAPYQIILNGLPYATSPDPIIEVMGLGVGTYNIQIVDAAGCESNIITVTIPFPDEPVSFGTTIFNIPYDQSNVEHIHHSTMLSSGIVAGLKYRLGKFPHRLKAVYVPKIAHGDTEVRDYAEIEHLTELTSLSGKKFNLDLEGGVGIRTTSSYLSGYGTAFATMHVSTKVEVGKILHVQAEMSLRCWQTIEVPQWGVTLTLPFIK